MTADTESKTTQTRVRWIVALALGLVGGVGIGRVLWSSQPSTSSSLAASKPQDVRVLHDVIARDAIVVDVFLPAQANKQGQAWFVLLRERGFPPPDERERTHLAMADAMQRRGIPVAVVSFPTLNGAPIEGIAPNVEGVIRELLKRRGEWELPAPDPALMGDHQGASLAVHLSHVIPSRGVVGFNGEYDAKANASKPPPLLLLSAHAESPRAAQSTRFFSREGERRGWKIYGYHVASRDEHSLTNLSGEKNDVGDLVAGFILGEVGSSTRVSNNESEWAIADVWGKNAPLSTEPFWQTEARLIVRHDIDDRFRAQIRRVFGEYAAPRELEPWPSLTYDAIDLNDYLLIHPELGSGDWIEITNARGEKLVYSRKEIEQDKPRLVIGVDDEKNLFRLFVTYNVLRQYSWTADGGTNPLFARPVGAFLHWPNTAKSPTTLADFALTKDSFRVVANDPLAAARTTGKQALTTMLTNEQGCLQCHAFRGVGARSRHLRAIDGKPDGGNALAFEDYPLDVLKRFLFEQPAVAKAFGVNPIHVNPTAANELVGLMVSR